MISVHILLLLKKSLEGMIDDMVFTAKSMFFLGSITFNFWYWVIGIYHHFQKFFSYVMTTRLNGVGKPRQLLQSFLIN